MRNTNKAPSTRSYYTIAEKNGKREYFTDRDRLAAEDRVQYLVRAGYKIIEQKYTNCF